MSQLYLTLLPNADAQRADKAVASAIEQAGLLEGGGVAVENVATDSVDLAIEGQFRFGKLISSKLAEEVDSISSSTYTALPLTDIRAPNGGRTRGYYEVEDADVSPAKTGVEHAFEYTLTLTNAGTREDSRRAVTTNPQTVDTVYPDATAAPVIAIPDSATDVRWFDDASGTEPASVTATAEAEFGTIARYDPTAATADAPTLTYDLDFADDGPTDVRVYDSRDRVKFAATASGGEVNTWIHAYHTGYQFDGACVIDTGRFRLLLDGDLQTVTERNDARTIAAGETLTVASGETVVDEGLTVEDGGTLTVESGGAYIDAGDTRTDAAASEWDPTNGVWEPIAIDPDSPWTLQSWSLTRIRPARAELQTLWSDGTSEATLNAVGERGADRLVWEVPENASTPPQGLIDLLDPTARDTDETAHATQGLIDRSALED